MSQGRRTRKLGFRTDEEKKQLVEAMRAAREAAQKVHIAYAATTIPYKAASTVLENCTHLAVLVSGDERIFEAPWPQTPKTHSLRD